LVSEISLQDKYNTNAISEIYGVFLVVAKSRL